MNVLYHSTYYSLDNKFHRFLSIFICRGIRFHSHEMTVAKFNLYLSLFIKPIQCQTMTVKIIREKSNFCNFKYDVFTYKLLKSVKDQKDLSDLLGDSITRSFTKVMFLMCHDQQQNCWLIKTMLVYLPNRSAKTYLKRISI